MAQQKKEEEERLRKEEADKKAKEAEEKRKRLEEAEKKRQAMMQAQKEKQQAAGQGAKGPKKTDSGVSTLSCSKICSITVVWTQHGYIKEKLHFLVSTQTGHARKNTSGDRGGNDSKTDNESFPRQSPLQLKIKKKLLCRCNKHNLLNMLYIKKEKPIFSLHYCFIIRYSNT